VEADAPHLCYGERFDRITGLARSLYHAYHVYPVYPVILSKKYSQDGEDLGCGVRNGGCGVRVVGCGMRRGMRVTDYGMLDGCRLRVYLLMKKQIWVEKRDEEKVKALFSAAHSKIR
jgi:hypothetical protein